MMMLMITKVMMLMMMTTDDDDDGDEDDDDNLNSRHIDDNRLARLARLTWTRVIVGNYPKI